MTAVKQALAHSEWSDGVERPASYDGDALSRAIQMYFSKPQDEELARLRAENKALKVRAAAAAGIADP